MTTLNQKSFALSSEGEVTRSQQHQLFFLLLIGLCLASLSYSSAGHIWMKIGKGLLIFFLLWLESRMKITRRNATCMVFALLVTLGVCILVGTGAIHRVACYAMMSVLIVWVGIFNEKI